MLVLIAVVALALCALAVGAATYGLVLPQARAASRLREIEGYGYAVAVPIGGLGQVGKDEDRQSPILELATRIGAAVSNRVGRGYVENVRRKLVAAALYKVDPQALVGLQILGAGLLGGLSLVLRVGGSPGTTILVAIFAALVAFATPYVAIHGRARRRLDTIDRGLPDLIDMLVVT